MVRYEGLKVGLEVHIQLDTGRKLFCKCGAECIGDVDFRFTRRLRPTQSELGQVDPAALFEFQKGLEIEYQVDKSCVCLVEMDEEPPHEPDELAISIALRTAMFLNMDVVDEIHFMRKIVVDGSNTTGFQRTAIIGLNGWFELNGKKYGVQTLAIEEEASRLMERREGRVIYSLDRLGIPLIEISTSPDIGDPGEAVEVASYLGRLIKTTGYKKGGIGSVRQDINISVHGGNVVEVKGVQKLDQLKKVIEYEYNRQMRLMEIASLLRERGVKDDDVLSEEEADITLIFSTTSSKILRKILEKGGKIYGIRLKGFRGVLGYDVGGKTFAKEILERIRFWTGIRGLFHSDELPKYGVSDDEVRRVSELLGLGGDDAFIIIGFEDVSQIKIAFEKIRERCVEAIYGVPAETRAANEDGSTYFMRPRPGMARMYPETDVRPIRVDKEVLKEVGKRVPISDPEKLLNTIVEKYNLARDEALELFNRDKLDLFEKVLSKYPVFKPRYVLNVILSLPKTLEREGYNTSRVDDGIFLEIFKHLSSGQLAKEAVEDVLRDVCRGISVDESVERRRVKVTVEDIRRELDNILRERRDIMSLPREVRVKRVIGIIMSKYRGSVNPIDVKKVVEESIG